MSTRIQITDQSTDVQVLARYSYLISAMDEHDSEARHRCCCATSDRRCDEGAWMAAERDSLQQAILGRMAR